MSYMTRDDVPYHCALADAFTVGDAYFCSVMGPTNPNRDYMWTGCIGNLNNLGPGGTDGHGAGPVTAQRSQRQRCVLCLEDVPRSAAGGRCELEDLPGPRRGDLRAGFRGWIAHNRFAGNYGDTTVLYFNQYFDCRYELAALPERLHGH